LTQATKKGRQRIEERKKEAASKQKKEIRKRKAQVKWKKRGKTRRPGSINIGSLFLLNY